MKRYDPVLEIRRREMYCNIVKRNSQLIEARTRISDAQCKACGSRNMEEVPPRFDVENEELVFRWVCKDCVPEAIRGMIWGKVE